MVNIQKQGYMQNGVAEYIRTHGISLPTLSDSAFNNSLYDPAGHTKNKARECLEFLGDKAAGFCVAVNLCQLYPPTGPDASPGLYSNLDQIATCNATFLLIMEQAGVWKRKADHLSAQIAVKHEADKVAADAFESILGRKLDPAEGGLPAVLDWVTVNLAPLIVVAKDAHDRYDLASGFGPEPILGKRSLESRITDKGSQPPPAKRSRTDASAVPNDRAGRRPRRPRRKLLSSSSRAETSVPVRLCILPQAVNADRSASLKAGNSSQEPGEVSFGDGTEKHTHPNSAGSFAVSPAALTQNAKDESQEPSLLTSSSDLAGADSVAGMSSSSSDMSLATVSSISDILLESLPQVVAHPASDHCPALVDTQHLQQSASSSVTHGSSSMPPSHFGQNSRTFDQAPSRALWHGREECQNSGARSDDSQISKIQPLEHSSQPPQPQDPPLASSRGNYAKCGGSSTLQARPSSSHCKENQASSHTEQFVRDQPPFRLRDDYGERRANPLVEKRSFWSNLKHRVYL
ncbi:hypothetical protein HWV62_1763 [Athelia sp. TMB]|nr:hypothetical protein HWV62_1763 [Athelia sp. TMB]